MVAMTKIPELLLRPIEKVSRRNLSAVLKVGMVSVVTLAALREAPLNCCIL